MKVKILNATLESYWYSNHIGYTFTVDYNIHDRENSYKHRAMGNHFRNADVVITELPESFCVKRCDDKEKWEKYVKWLNKKYYFVITSDKAYPYYGKKGINDSIGEFTPFGTEIHIDDMIKHIDYMRTKDSITVTYENGKFIEVKEEINMETQKLSRQGLKEIHEVACTTWKETLEQYGSRNLFDNYIELTQEEVNRMFYASDEKQKTVLSKYLVQDDGSVDVSTFEVGNKGIFDGTSGTYIIRDREMGKYSKKSFLLSQKYSWEFREDEFGQLCLIPTKKK